jgi:hypothetical protein
LTFLNPMVLFGLAAAAIPILLHIFNLRRLQTIEFSTLLFLKELQKTKIRRLKLRQLFLLLLRILIVMFIVMAFSRPTLKGSLPGGLAKQAKTSAIILFDDSESMTASDEEGELLHQAINSAAAIVNLLKEGDEVTLVKLSEIPTEGIRDIPLARHDIFALRTTIKDIKPSALHRTLEDALRFTSRLLSVSKNFNKEVYLISDFQSGSLESRLNVSQGNEHLFSATTQFFFIPLGKRELQNIAVEKIEIPNALFEVNKPFLVKAKLVNHSSSDVQNHLVSIYQDGNRTAQKGIDIRAGQTVETDFTIVPRHTGFLEGIIESEDDDLEFDNKRFFTVHIPEELRVLLVGNPSDLTYLRLALQARLSDSSSSITIAESSYSRFSSTLLNTIDVLVLSNPPSLPSGQTSALKTFLQNGGGALIFPGNQSSIDAFNASIAGPLGISTISSIDQQSEASSSAGFSFEFDKVDLRHPLFDGMFEREDTKQSSHSTESPRVFESPNVRTTVRFIPTPHSKTILTLSNGDPFLIEDRIGNGRTLMMSVPATMNWSDLPRKGLFVPFVHRSLAYLAQEPLTDRSLSAGDERTIRLRTSAPPLLQVTTPDGIGIDVNVQQRRAEKSIHFYNTERCGIYTVKAGNVTLDKFAVNIDPEESNTTPSGEKRQDDLLKRLGISDHAVHIIHHPQDVQHIIRESRVGTELWKQFLAAALLLAIIEMFAARENKQSFISATAHKNV